MIIITEALKGTIHGTPNIPREKRELRARFIKMRAALSDPDRIAKSRAIEKRVFAIRNI